MLWGSKDRAYLVPTHEDRSSRVGRVSTKKLKKKLGSNIMQALIVLNIKNRMAFKDGNNAKKKVLALNKRGVSIGACTETIKLQCLQVKSPIENPHEYSIREV